MGRLQNLLALVTGGSGGIGSIIAKQYLEEGATVIITGRSLQKLENTCQHLTSSNSTFKERLHFIVMDSSDIYSVEKGVKEIAKFGSLDILINNAGSGGPIQLIHNLPLDKADLINLRNQGCHDSETISDAVGSLLGCPWFMTCALLPCMKRGASVINVSTIFSKTDYFGRTAYVTPKAALNMLGHVMAEELGTEKYAIRVNTIYPGPVESERIDRVFTAMDKLKQVEPGTTRQEMLETMCLKKTQKQGALIAKEEIANIAVFLGSPESSGVSNQDFEIAHGFHYEDVDTSGLILDQNPVWIIGGNETGNALVLVEKHSHKELNFVLTFRTDQAVENAKKIIQKSKVNCTVSRLDPGVPEDWKKIETLFANTKYPKSVHILPRLSYHEFNRFYGSSTSELILKKIQDFLDNEIVDLILLARQIARIYEFQKESSSLNTSIYFQYYQKEAKNNPFAKIRQEALHQLIRTWRYERKFCCNPKTHLAISDNLMHGFYCERKKNRSELRNKAALVTGGSEGIGREIAKALLESGAKAMIASRSKLKLAKSKDECLEEISSDGFHCKGEHFLTAICDVGNPESIESAFKSAIANFGTIDILINNAGIPGQEKPIVDMPLEGWQNTMQANLISNYHLLLLSAPYMKQQGEGHIICLSSRLGGAGNTFPRYPNRADYAVTKAGQRGLAESFSSLLGPEIFINSIAPGPVHGDRIKGTKSPGLYDRRAKINIENKRLNQVYNFLVKRNFQTSELTEILRIVFLNDIELITNHANYSNELHTLIEDIKARTKDARSSLSTHLFTHSLADKLLDRLRLTGKLPSNKLKDEVFSVFHEPPSPFISGELIAKDSETILRKTLGSIALGHMPSERDIAKEIVFNLMDYAVTGETLYPSCGYHLSNVSTRGNFIGSLIPSAFENLPTKQVVILGNSMYDEMAEIAFAFTKGKHIQKIVVVAGSETSACEIQKRLHKLATADEQLLSVILVNKNLKNVDQTLSDTLKEFGLPDVLISLPLGPLPDKSTQFLSLPSLEEFNLFTENHITAHFQVAKRGSLIDNCKVIFVTHSLQPFTGEVSTAFAQLSQTALAPLCATAAQEASRLSHQAVFYQLDQSLDAEAEQYQRRLIDAIITIAELTDDFTKHPKKGKSPLGSGTILLI